MCRRSLALLWLLLAGCGPEPPHFDIIIDGGSIHDGTGRPTAATRIGIVGDRIAAMDPAASATASRYVDASGLIVMPGFIDPHTHALPDQAPADAVANENYLRQGVTTLFVGSDGRGLDDPALTFAALDTAGTGPNIAFLAGHGQIREAVLGRENRAPTSGELEAMRALLDAQMKVGAFGLSTGLFYVPGSYSDTAEVIELARVAASHGGVYDTHMRDESSYTVGLLAAVDETIDIARATGIPVHISHIKALGKDVWGLSSEIVERVEAARGEGLDVTANQYPWRASGTRFSNALIPRHAMAEGVELDLDNIDPALRQEMLDNLDRRGGPNAMLVTDADSPFRGLRLDEIAEALGTDPLDAGLRLALDDNPSIASFVMDPIDIDTFAYQSWVMTGSDGSRGHPRLYGSYPKAWQDLVVDGSMTADAFARRSAGLVAETFRLCDRGRLDVGYAADIVVFDASAFEPRATYENPTTLAEGVVTLIINGELVIDEGGPLGSLAGRGLLKTRPECMD